MISLMYFMTMREEVQSSKMLQRVENQPDILQTASTSTQQACHHHQPHLLSERCDL